MTAEKRATVQLRRRFGAPPRVVFDAWVDPGKVRRWIAAQTSGDAVVHFDMKPRVGQTFSLVVRRGRDEVSHCGEYLEIVHPRRLVFTWVVPIVSKETTLVSIDLSPVPSVWGGTDLLLTHERVLPADTGLTEARWGGVLDVIATIVQP